MLSRIPRSLCAVALTLTAVAASAEERPSHTPPAPEPPTPAASPCRAAGPCQLLSSDAFACGADPECLPQCRPLPELNPAPTDCTKSRPGKLELFARGLLRGHAPKSCSDSQPKGSFTVTIGARARCRSNQTAAAELTSNQSAPTTDFNVDSLTPLQHLQKAADHLEAAGRHDDAQHIRQQAEVMRKHARQRLQELRRQQQQIQQQIEQLERMTGTSEQIQLKVSMLEIDEARLAQYRQDNELPDDFVFQSPGGWAALPAERAQEQLDQLRHAGVVKILAEPTLITRNAQQASIHTGGEFPILVPQQDGNFTIQYRDCGVRMTATPHLLGDNRLRLHLAPEFSRRNEANAITTSGTRIPAITTRRLNAEVELRFGETAVLCGLRSLRGHVPVAGRAPNLPDQLSNALIQLTGGSLQAIGHHAGSSTHGTSFVVMATPVLLHDTPDAAAHAPARRASQPRHLFNP